MDLNKFTPKLLGHIGVDAGIVWIGDPCYILHKENNPKMISDKNPKSIGKNWNEFCEKFFESEHDSFKSFTYDSGSEGLGICTSTYYGDGQYPVIGFFKSNETRPLFIIVDFNDEFSGLI